MTTTGLTHKIPDSPEKGDLPQAGALIEGLPAAVIVVDMPPHGLARKYPGMQPRKGLLTHIDCSSRDPDLATTRDQPHLLEVQTAAMVPFWPYPIPVAGRLWPT